jgi:FO synthase
VPGTAAEVLEDGVRQRISPNKLPVARWIEIITAAHTLGLRSTVTVMFGHIETPAELAEHMRVVRTLQEETGGFTEFVPLPFVHMEAPIALRGGARRGPTFGEALLVHAVARLALHPWITNIQASWPKLGPEGVGAALRAGVNDLGGTLMNESISRAAGASFGQELPPEEMETLIRSAGRVPRQRTTLYGEVPPDRVRASFGAAPLSEPVNPHVREAGLVAPPRLLRPGLLEVG